MTEQLFNHWVYVGTKTAEQKIAAILQVLHSFGAEDNAITAYECSHLTGVSPQHCARILKRMSREGVVGYKEFNRRGLVCRRWFAK